MSEPVRERTVRWEDPMAGAAAGRGMAGIDYLRAIREGRIPPPPIAVLLGFRLAEVEEGAARFEVEPGEHHYNPIGVVHGGLLATVLDSALGCAVHSLLPAGQGYTTIDLTVHFVRPVKRDTSLLHATARALHRGAQLATAQGEVKDGAGRLYAHATSACLVLRG
jgi:uncharacterized protein (TIGR00369 family)